MIANLRPAIVSVLLFTVVLGLAYPLAITGIAQAVVPAAANGALVPGPDGQPVRSRWVGQRFSRPEYLLPRPSAAGAQGYDASASSGSNLGPLNPALAERAAVAAQALRDAGVTGPIPADAVTASASGLDPDISPAFAQAQAARVALARGVPVAEVSALIAANTTGRLLGIIGQPRVNVLMTNLALDQAFPRAAGPAPVAPVAPVAPASPTP